jgi:hypothetical protein
MTARGTLAALVLPLALLSACGDDSDSAATDPGASDSSTATDTPSPTEQTAEPTDSPTATPAWPACDEVWVADAKLPLRYRGCLEGDEAVKADNLACSSGQRIVRYDNTFYSVAGGTIYRASGPLEKDKEYLKSIRVCRA